MKLSKTQGRICNAMKHRDKPMEFYFAHLTEEVGEAFKEWRKGRIMIRKDDGKLEGLPIELADVVLCALIIAEMNDIDMETAIEMKLSELETR